MDLKKISEIRFELAHQLLERMSPLIEDSPESRHFNAKVFVEFGSRKEDHSLMWNLFDALVGDAVIFKDEYQKGKDSSLA